MSSHLPEADCLSHTELAQAMVRMFDHARLPLNVLVYGDWGTGKSTYLDYLAEALPKPTTPKLDLKRPEATYHVVRFNPWAYETDPNLLLPLLGAIQDSLTDEMKGLDLITEAIEACFWAVADIGIRIGSKVWSGGKAQVGADSLKKRWEAAGSPKYVDQVRACQENFAALVSRIRDARHVRAVVIMLDDMDRCSPDSVISLIEGVKLYFGQNLGTPVVFVWAMDRDVVTKAIEHKYDKATFRGADYLEKIFDFQTPVPRLAEDSVLRLVESFCKSSKAKSGFEKLLRRRDYPSSLANELNKAATRNPRTVHRLLAMLEVLAAQADVVISYATEQAKTLKGILEPNDPRIKDFFSGNHLIQILILAYRFRDWRFGTLHHPDRWSSFIDTVKSQDGYAEYAEADADLMAFLGHVCNLGVNVKSLSLEQNHLKALLLASQTLQHFGF